ncbi:MAG: HU family DNA-binding protein [Kiritimatiellae bacterium]|nr:HU family DNA-binding protein [Kiritimatiellia bacterium]
MGKPLTKTQIITKIADDNGLTKKQAKSVIASIVALAYKSAKDGFTIPGLGKLVVVSRKARTGRNPRTGEQIKIKAKKVLKFRIAKAAKDAILPAK